MLSLGAGMVSGFAGQSVKWADGVGTVVAFYFPQSVSVSSGGTVYVADTNNHRIRMIATSGGLGYCSCVCIFISFCIFMFLYAAGLVSTVAGSGVCAFADGVGSAAQFCNLYAIAVASNGNLFVADILNNRVRVITTAGKDDCCFGISL